MGKRIVALLAGLAWLPACGDGTPEPIVLAVTKSEFDDPAELWAFFEFGPGVKLAETAPGEGIWDLRWSPDRRHVAYQAASSAGYRFFLLSLETQTGVLIGENVVTYEWSPGGTRLAFADHVTETLHTVEPDGSGMLNLGPAYGFVWQPGADMLAVVGPSGLRLEAADGSLSVPVDPDASGSMSWSPDGARLLYSAARIPPEPPWNTQVLRICPSSGSPTVTVSEAVILGDPIEAPLRHPSWSPDGSRFTFYSWIVDRPVLQVTPADIPDPKVLALPGSPAEFSWSEWSSDSRYSCISWVDYQVNRSGLQISDAEGGEVWPLGPGGEYAWNPRRALLAVHVDSGVALVDPVRRRREFLEIPGVMLGELAWSPDGSELAIPTLQGVYSWRQGSDVRRFPGGQASWVRWSGDGRMLFGVTGAALSTSLLALRPWSAPRVLVEDTLLHMTSPYFFAVR